MPEWEGSKVLQMVMVRTVSQMGLSIWGDNRGGLLCSQQAEIGLMAERQHTCDMDRHAPCLTVIDKLHDSVNDLLVEAACKPALHETPMHQGAGAAECMTPHRGVGYPPGLQALRQHTAMLTT